MKIFTRVEGTTLLWKNPRTEEWEPITSFSTPEAAAAATSVFAARDFSGWESIKLSKSSQKGTA